MGDSFRLGTDGIYRCDAFQEFVWQQHGFGTRLGNPTADVTLKQIHSNVVLNAHGLKDREREGDALVTDEIGKSIGIRTADCVPILLLDCRNRAVAAVHAGWRGTADEVSKHALSKMGDDFGPIRPMFMPQWGRVSAAAATKWETRLPSNSFRFFRIGNRPFRASANWIFPKRTGARCRTQEFVRIAFSIVAFALLATALSFFRSAASRKTRDG